MKSLSITGTTRFSILRTYDRWDPLSTFWTTHLRWISPIQSRCRVGRSFLVPISESSIITSSTAMKRIPWKRCTTGYSAVSTKDINTFGVLECVSISRTRTIRNCHFFVPTNNSKSTLPFERFHSSLVQHERMYSETSKREYYCCLI